MARRDTWLVGELIYDEAITSLIESLSGVATEDVLYEFGKEVRDAADPPKDTGALEASGSVYTRRNSDFRERVSEASSKRGEAKFGTKVAADVNEVIMHWPIHYATYIELGTSLMPARPYAIPALEEKRDILPSMLIKEYRNELTFKQTVFRLR